MRFKQKKPVREVRVNEDVQIRELDQKGGVADPGDGDLPVLEFWENGFRWLARGAA